MQGPYEDILKAAILATSVDNCQPWLFSARGHSIEIYIDSKRAEFFGDAGGTASYVTAGAVIENIVIAAEHLGFSALPEYFPSEDRTLMARVNLSEASIKGNALFKWLPLRCTNRRIYNNKTAVSKDDLEAVKNSINDIAGAKVFLISDKKDIKKIAVLAKKADTVIFSHRLLHKGLFKWIRWTQDEADKTRDGLPITTLELNSFQQKAFRLISSWNIVNFLNKFGINRIISGQSYRLMKSAPAVGIITMDNNTPEDYINGGRAFERIWLTAASRGLAFQPMGGIVFLTTKFRLNAGGGFSRKQQACLKEIYNSLCSICPVKEGTAHIIIFRMGYAKPPSGRSLRRSAGDVLKTS
jgi:nitroreductase